MKRLMRPVRTSIWLAFQDTGQFYGLRVMIELSVAILAVVLALIVTGQATPWTIIADRRVHSSYQTRSPAQSLGGTVLPTL